jgi:autotransporter family porin
VRATSFAENKAVNGGSNRTTGHGLGPGFFSTSDDARANTLIGARVDGAFTGTTQQVLRWAGCKWGIDEDIVYAQAAKESWWRQTAEGDWGSDPTQCAPGHGLGVDGRAGQCPESFGILQNRYATERSSWPGIGSSTAMNADTAYAIWRTCFEGYELWLNTVDRGAPYGAGDPWGCVGRWFAGRWHTGPADQYIAGVQAYLRQRIWDQRDFQEA